MWNSFLLKFQLHDRRLKVLITWSACVKDFLQPKKLHAKKDETDERAISPSFTVETTATASSILLSGKLERPELLTMT